MTKYLLDVRAIQIEKVEQSGGTNPCWVKTSITHNENPHDCPLEEKKRDCIVHNHPSPSSSPIPQRPSSHSDANENTESLKHTSPRRGLSIGDSLDLHLLLLNPKAPKENTPPSLSLLDHVRTYPWRPFLQNGH